jgi:hypothetical protein
MTTRRLWQLALTTALALTPMLLAADALAQSGPVNQFLTGGTIDPMATTLKVVPPEGGMVMVHRDGKAVAWLMQAGYVRLKPNREYGIVATRGTSMLFNGGLYARPGLTQFRWTSSDTPEVSYQPAVIYGRPHHKPAARTHRAKTKTVAPPKRRAERATTHAAPRKPAAAAKPAKVRPSAATFARIIAKLEGLESDRARVAAIEGYAQRYTFTHAQAKRLTVEVGRAHRKQVSRALGLAR